MPSVCRGASNDGFLRQSTVSASIAEVVAGMEKLQVGMKAGTSGVVSPATPGAGMISHDVKRICLAATAFFLLLCSYYTLRPVRDAMGVETGAARLQWLFTGTFLFTLVTVPLFGWVAKHLHRSRLIPGVYGFLIVSLIVFYALFSAGITLVEAAAFFIWLSVFNLLIVSLFWSGVSDVFATEESHKFYGYIAAAGTAGALAGPATTALLARQIATENLLALAAGLLAAAAACMVAFRRPRTTGSRNGAESRPIGGSLLAGISLTGRAPELRGIALLVICYSAISTVLYIELADAVGKTYAGTGTRTAFYATLDLTVNGLALAMQLLGTRRIVRRHGLRAALSLVPLAVLMALLFLGAWRSALLLAALQVLLRAGEFSLVRPGREMIYTTVDAESRYKAKNFIDTAVYRANDAGVAWIVSAVRTAGLNAAWLVALPAAVLWLVTGFRLGRRHDQVTHKTPDANESETCHSNEPA
jgi:AAA family ATP:ADP antiporter